MIFWGAALALMTLTGAQADAPEPDRYAQVTVRQQIIVRVPARPRPGAAAAQQIEWKEGKGPKCVPARFIAGATLLGRDSVDLIFRNNSRVRAELENSCPALDYYHGFYISPNADGMICADRDVIRSRMGGECEIERFRSLKAEPRD
ncbi:MAG TPA: hypothetical protein VGD10_02125 [Allosphingosinicella sp.]|uniref:hypothetical protein n=1 Tax=Allosphingosinicella sp. TaxID=2823234 RepID=UPI002EDB97CF